MAKQNRLDWYGTLKQTGLTGGQLSKRLGISNAYGWKHTGVPPAWNKKITALVKEHGGSVDAIPLHTGKDVITTTARTLPTQEQVTIRTFEEQLMEETTIPVPFRLKVLQMFFQSQAVQA